MAKKIRKINLSKEISSYYIENKIEKLPETEILKPKNLKLISQLANGVNPNGRICRIFLKYPDVIDSILEQKNLALDYVSFWITKDYADLSILQSKKNVKTPEWDKIYFNIKQNFGEVLASKIVLTQKIAWYKLKEQWEDATRAFC